MTLLLLWSTGHEITVLADTLFGGGYGEGSEVGPVVRCYQRRPSCNDQLSWTCDSGKKRRWPGASVCDYERKCTPMLRGMMAMEPQRSVMLGKSLEIPDQVIVDHARQCAQLSAWLCKTAVAGLDP